MWDKISQSIFFKSLVDALRQAWEWLHTVIMNSLMPAFRELWRVISEDLWPQIQNLWKALEPFKPFLEILGAIIAGVVVVAIIAMAAALSGILIIVAKVLEAITGLAEMLVRAAARKIQDFTTFVMKLVDAFKGLFEWVNKVWQKLQDFTSSGASLNPFSSSFKLPFVGRAGGGPVDAGQSYIVGEHGPEIITAGANGFVTPLGANGGGNVVVHIQNYIGTQEFSRQIGNDLANILKMNKRL
jgi:hypothetical protein